MDIAAVVNAVTAAVIAAVVDDGHRHCERCRWWFPTPEPGGVSVGERLFHCEFLPHHEPTHERHSCGQWSPRKHRMTASEAALEVEAEAARSVVAKAASKAVADARAKTGWRLEGRISLD